MINRVGYVIFVQGCTKIAMDHARMTPQDLKLKLDAKTLLIAET